MIRQHQHFDLLGKVILERVVFEPPLRVFDKMEDEACLLYAVDGTSTVYGINENMKLDSGESVLMKCGNYYNQWHKNESNKENEAVAIHLYPDVLKYIYEEDIPPFLKSVPSANPKFIHSLKGQQLIKVYIDSLLFYFENPDVVDEYITILKVKELVSLLYKLDSNGIRDILHDLFNPHNVDFKEAIHTHLYQDFSMEELAQLTNMSLSSFKRKFKETFQLAPATYIRKKRLEKAAQLLQASELRIIDVCYDSGFNDVGTFSKAFKAAYGKSPSDFREGILGQE